MSKVTVEELLDELYEMIDRASRVPFSGKCMINADEFKSVLDELHENLPQEINQARAIVADRSRILEDARRESDAIVRSADEKAKAMVSQEEIVRQAQDRAADIMDQNQEKVRQMRKATNDYIDEVMLKVDDAVAAVLSELRQTRQSIRASQKKD